MTTPAQSRRRALLALLDQYPMERELYLYEGRRTVAPREEFADKIEALFAADESRLFQDVMQASKTFVERFPGGHLTEDGTVTKFLEESEEFYEAATDYTPYRNAYDAHVHRERMLGEAFDVMVTMGGVLSFFGVTWHDIGQAMRAGLDKLNSRTEADYGWDEKSQTIMKRSKMEKQS